MIIQQRDTYESCESCLSVWQRMVKRLFDLVAASILLFLTWPIILVAYLLACLDTGTSGLFRQERIGMHGRSFRIYKIRTMRDDHTITTTVTSADDARITSIGGFLRRAKVDELPQLLNVLQGEMSFVGPRPDVKGFADRLVGRDRIILSVRPGITGPATLRFRSEEDLLARQPDPEKYNREVIFPEKVRINREYVENYRFSRDLYYLWKTLAG